MLTVKLWANENNNINKRLYWQYHVQITETLNNIKAEYKNDNTPSDKYIVSSSKSK